MAEIQQGNTDYVGAVLNRLDQLRNEYMNRARQIARDEHGILDEQVAHARKRLRGSGFKISTNDTEEIKSRQPLGEKSMNEVNLSGDFFANAQAQTADYKYSELQAELKRRQINAKGKKEILKARLDKAIATELEKAAAESGSMTEDVIMDESEDYEESAVASSSKEPENNIVRNQSNETSATTDVSATASGATTVAVPRQGNYLATLIGIFDTKAKRKSPDNDPKPPTESKSPSSSFKKGGGPYSPRAVGPKPSANQPPIVETVKPIIKSTETSVAQPPEQLVQSVAPPPADPPQPKQEIVPMDEDAKPENQISSADPPQREIAKKIQSTATTSINSVEITKPEINVAKIGGHHGGRAVTTSHSRPIVTTTSTTTSSQHQSRLEGVRARQERERLRVQAEHEAREKERLEKAAAARREQEELTAKRAEERKKLQDAANLRRQQNDDSRLRQKVSKPTVPTIASLSTTHGIHHQAAPGIALPSSSQKSTVVPRPPQHPPPNYAPPAPPIEQPIEQQSSQKNMQPKVISGADKAKEKPHATAPVQAAPPRPTAPPPLPMDVEKKIIPLHETPHPYGSSRQGPPRLTPASIATQIQSSASRPQIGATAGHYVASGHAHRIPPRLSPVDTYEMSDREESTDCESDDESGNPEKHVPTWAQNPNLREALHKQESVDPLHFFNLQATSCNLNQVFNTSKQFKRRTSSQNWSQDLTTFNERQKYRIEMGFTPPK